MKKRFVSERESTGTFIFPPDQLIISDEGVALLRPHMFGASKEELSYKDITGAQVSRGTKWYRVKVYSRLGSMATMVLNGLSSEEAEEAARLINERCKGR